VPAASARRRWRSLILVSPVFDQAAWRDPGFARRNAGRPVLVLSGGRDDRVPPDYVESNVAGLADVGAIVTSECEAAANHFLFFSHRDWLQARVGEWLGRNHPDAPTP